MKKILRFLLIVVLLSSPRMPLHAASADEGEKSALTLRANALQKENVRESLKYLTSHLHLAKNDIEKRSVLYYTACLQETLGQFVAAASSYAQAAAIEADNAQGMPAASNAELYLYAARSSLEACDFQGADSYLDAAPVNSSTDERLIAQKRLLSAWSALCKAGDYKEAKGVVANLEEFEQNPSLKDIRCEVLFTLWYITDDSKWSEILTKDYPHSPEASIAGGNGVVMAMPFWYFMPRAALYDNDGIPGNAMAEKQESSPAQAKVPEPAPASKQAAPISNTASRESPKPSSVREQIGFFREKENAQKLIERAAASGFSAYYYTETRPSGIEYYVVVVDEDEGGSMGKKLRTAGFDCYPIKD